MKKSAVRMKQATTTAPKAGGKSIGKKQSAGHSMGGMFGNVTPKKPEPDNFAPKRADVRPKKGSTRSRLEGVKL